MLRLDVRSARLALVSLALACLALILGPGAASAQIPDKFTNLKILPKGISKPELVSVMRGFSMGLGVCCEFCHVDEESPKRLDYASDEKKNKVIARSMMKMTREINGKLIPKAGIENPAQVRCVTCHHGISRPVTLADTLEAAIQRDGVQAGENAYKELRAKYYGSGAYDFRPGSLNSVAEWLAQDRKDFDGAIAIMHLSITQDPNSAQSYAMLGRFQEANGDKAAAIVSYKKSLELDPENPRVQQALKQAEGGQ